MFHRLGVGVLLVVVLCGVSGCQAARAALVAELARDIDRRVSDLEAQNDLLIQQINELRRVARQGERKITVLERMASTITTQIEEAEDEADSVRQSIGKLDEEIEQLSRAPLEPGETERSRKERLASLARQRDENKIRLVETRKLLRRFQKTVEDMRGQLAAQ